MASIPVLISLGWGGSRCSPGDPTMLNSHGPQTAERVAGISQSTAQRGILQRVLGHGAWRENSGFQSFE